MTIHWEVNGWRRKTLWIAFNCILTCYNTYSHPWNWERQAERFSLTISWYNPRRWDAFYPGGVTGLLSVESCYVVSSSGGFSWVMREEEVGTQSSISHSRRRGASVKSSNVENYNSDPPSHNSCRFQAISTKGSPWLVIYQSSQETPYYLFRSAKQRGSSSDRN